MNNINRVVLTGNLTADPELRPLPSGTSVGRLRLAVNTRRKNSQTGEWEEKPNYFDVTVWGAQAENCAQYLAKGRPVAVDGRLEWREYTTQDGQKRQAVEVIADSVQFLAAARPVQRVREHRRAELGDAGAERHRRLRHPARRRPRRPPTTTSRSDGRAARHERRAPGCGAREPGGAYLAVPLGPGGSPVEAFLIDPPVAVDAQALGLAAVGTTMIERDGGVTHVLDVVGREHYPTVAGFVDEARRLGISRRISKTAAFGRLTPDSRLLVLHPHALIANAAEFPPPAPAARAAWRSIWRKGSARCASGCGGRSRFTGRKGAWRSSPRSRSPRSRW